MMEDTRIQAEAAFQDARARRADSEPRDKYYTLAERAYTEYRHALGDSRGKRVLVVGCAEGGVTPLARAGATVEGIDISAEALAKLTQAIASEGLSSRAHVGLMNAEDVTFDAESFDMICCSGVLHHLRVEAAIASWARVLKRDGSLVMIEPMAWNPVVAGYRWLTPNDRTADEHPLTPADIRLLHDHFGDVDVRGFVLLSVVGALWAFSSTASHLLTPVVRLLQWIDRALLRAIPALAYFCWTAVIICRQPIDRTSHGTPQA